MFNVAKIAYRLLRRPRKRSKGVYRITSGNECWNRNVLEAYGRQKLMVQTECHLAESSRTLRLRPETNDGRLLTDGMTYVTLFHPNVLRLRLFTTLHVNKQTASLDCSRQINWTVSLLSCYCLRGRKQKNKSFTTAYSFC